MGRVILDLRKRDGEIPMIDDTSEDVGMKGRRWIQESIAMALGALRVVLHL